MLNKDLTFKQLEKKTLDLVERFKQVEQKEWGIEGCMIELSKQVGELSRCVMKMEKYYFAQKGETNLEEIGDELSDILFMIIRIAKHYNIDLEKAHLKAIDDANKYLEKNF